MIFIPGGEFESLDASLPIYNSERLVNKTNVIIAFVQYRLGNLFSIRSLHMLFIDM